MLLDQGSCLHQQKISREMAVAVIHCLQMIHIKDTQAEGGAAPVNVPFPLRHLLLKGILARHLRQLIRVGLLENTAENTGADHNRYDADGHGK